MSNAQAANFSVGERRDRRQSLEGSEVSIRKHDDGPSEEIALDRCGIGVTDVDDSDGLRMAIHPWCEAGLSGRRPTTSGPA